MADADRHFSIEVSRRTKAARITGTVAALEQLRDAIKDAIEKGAGAVPTVYGAEVVVRRED